MLNNINYSKKMFITPVGYLRFLLFIRLIHITLLNLNSTTTNIGIPAAVNCCTLHLITTDIKLLSTKNTIRNSDLPRLSLVRCIM